MRGVRFLRAVLPCVDLLLTPLVYPSAFLLKLVRMTGVGRLPYCKRALLRVGAFPVINHYFEPLFDDRLLRYPLDRERYLPGIEWNEEEQLGLLDAFTFAGEIRAIAEEKGNGQRFNFDNNSFRAGDADFLYNLIRLKQPKRFIEIGSGNSTIMAIRAIRRNGEEIPAYHCLHVCIEPYEVPWLEEAGVTVVRQKVEEMDRRIFEQLESGDILFIDSTHVIRPQGDVLFEYLELLPTLKKGVIVHIHDIFTPRDYPREMLVDQVRFWNEQYLLEAFLTHNSDWQVLAAVNWLRHQHFQRLQEKCPMLTRDDEPGSFYLQKVI